MEFIPRAVQLMETIARELKMWFQDAPGDEDYPSGTVDLRNRNGVSLNIELLYLDELLTLLRVNNHKEIARSLEQDRDRFLPDLQAVEQAIEIGEGPPFSLTELKMKITHLIGTLEYTAKYFGDKLTPEKPGEPAANIQPAEPKEQVGRKKADLTVQISQSNVKGMSWQKAKTKAEKYLEDNKFPGITKLAKKIGCSRNTMGKAIKQSDILKEAEQKYYKERSRAPRAVTLTDKVLVSHQASDVTDPSVIADTEAILKKLIEDAPQAMREETKEELRNMSDEQRQKTAALYAKQIDDDRQDNPKKKKPRRRKV